MKTLERFFLITTACLTTTVGCHARNSPEAIASSTPRFLTSGVGFADYWPCFSPDGTKVLFSRHADGSRSWELWIVGADGSGPRRLTHEALPVSATRASWSVNTGLIALTGVSNSGKSSVWIIRPDGTLEERQPTGLPEGFFYPSWYPSGDELAVMDGHDLVIKRVDLARGTTVPLTNRNRIFTGMPSVSPDGKWIAFAGQLNRGRTYDQSQNSIWLLDLTNGIEHSLEPTPQQGRAPSWSPDSKRLAFESNRGSLLGRYAVFIVNSDGTGLQQITDYELNATHPVWSPDGQKLAFAARDGWLSTGTKIATIAVPPTPR
jgi:Tol biopolymer transport system component